MAIPMGSSVTAGVGGFYEVKPEEVISLANRTEETALGLETDFREAKLASSTFEQAPSHPGNAVGLPDRVDL
jgi:hypothetical protein